MPIFFSNDQLDRAVESYQRSHLTDTPANAVFSEAVVWLATRMFKTRAYRIVFALCRELARLDYRLAQHRQPRALLVAKEPTLHETEALFEVLAAYPQHLKTASILASTALAYYRQQGYDVRVPHNIQPSPAERPNVQRVVE